MYVLVSGNLSDGFRFHGPFDSFDDAEEYEYANGVKAIEGWIATLHAPVPNRPEGGVASTEL